MIVSIKFIPRYFTRMSRTTIQLPDEMLDEVDDRRHSTTSRSQWIREAIQSRLDAEDEGEWSDGPDDTTDTEETETAVPDGGA